MNDTYGRLAISQSELFSAWPDEALARLIAHSEARIVEPDTCIHRAGDPARYIWLVISGSMSLLKEIPGGRDFTASLHLPGDFHGLGPAVAQAPHMFTAVCKEKTVLVQIPGDLIRAMIASDGHLSFSLFQALEKRHLRAQIRHADAAVGSMQTRITNLLKSIASRSIQRRNSSEINLSQDEIATMLGTRRQVVNRVLREMAKNGAIQVLYGRIVILDVDKLDRMASMEG